VGGGDWGRRGGLHSSPALIPPPHPFPPPPPLPPSPFCHPQHFRSIERERDYSLDFVSQHSKKLAEAVLRAEGAERRADEAARFASDLQAGKSSAEARVAQIKNVQDITSATLQQERAAARDATERAEKAEMQASGLRAEAGALRSQVAALSASHQEMQVTVAARAQEVLSLQAQVRQLTAELGDARSRLATLQRSASEGSATAEADLARLRRDLDAVTSERDRFQSSSKDANARATVLMVENGRLSEMLSAAQAQIGALQTAKANLTTTTATQIATLRDHLVAEQAARAEAKAALHVLELERERDLAERTRIQRAHDAERAVAHRTAVAAAAATATAGAAASPPPVPTMAGLASPGRTASSAAAQRSGGSAAATTVATRTATLVRDQLRSAGLDPSIADEYLISVRSGSVGGGGGGASDAGSMAAAAAAGTDGPASPSTHHRERIPSRNYVELPVGPAGWTDSLRKGAATDDPVHARAHAASVQSPAAAARGPAHLTSPSHAAARTSSGPLSPGAQALQEATTAYRAKRAAQQQQAFAAASGSTGEQQQPKARVRVLASAAQQRAVASSSQPAPPQPQSAPSAPPVAVHAPSQASRADGGGGGAARAAVGRQPFPSLTFSPPHTRPLPASPYDSSLRRRPRRLRDQHHQQHLPLRRRAPFLSPSSLRRTSPRPTTTSSSSERHPRPSPRPRPRLRPRPRRPPSLSHCRAESTP
jgi:trimeric autotransporter adhesin